MKAYSFENWLNNTIETPFLFFVQSMEEMLFPYGHDSYKVPTLNFHFLCVEILSSIEKIEADIIDKGNMRPMFDELSSVFENDYVARKLYGTDFYSLFYNKNDKGEYARDCAQLNKDPGSEISLKIIRKTLLFLIDDMAIEDKYLNTLKSEIEQLLQKTILNIKDSEKLSNLSRLLLTELINRGYSQEYIYAQIKERYYSCENEIMDVSEEINLFWEMFSFKEYKYNVILPIKRADIKKLLDHFQNITVTENKQELFGNSCRWVVEIEINSLDPESARIEASSLISLFVSLKQYNSHISKAYYANKARIQHYSERFSNRFELKKVLSNHRRRLEWQIMRIYRNRNMIVHDGSHFPYIDLIVQNLHFYIDALMDTINFYVGKGYTSLEVIYALLNRKEFEYHITLEKKDNNKNPLSINDDFVTTVLGNAYVE